MNENDESAMRAYRAALMMLIERAGGELFVPFDTTHQMPGGTMLYKIDRDGIRFRFVAEGANDEETRVLQ